MNPMWMPLFSIWWKFYLPVPPAPKKEPLE